MRPVALSDEIAVGDMPTAEQIAILAKAGFRALLNVQPDGEVERLMSSAEAERTASAAGMAYAHVPMETRRATDAAVDAIAKALAELPRPIYACCYSGARAAAGWALASAPVRSAEGVAAICAAAGFDVSAIMPEIVRRAGGSGAAIRAPTEAATAEPAAGGASAPASEPLAPAPAVTATEAAKIIFPRAAGSGGFAVAG